MYLFRNSLVDLVVLEVTKFVYVAAIEKADSNRLQKENKGEKKKEKRKKASCKHCYVSILSDLTQTCPMLSIYSHGVVPFLSNVYGRNVLVSFKYLQYAL